MRSFERLPGKRPFGRLLRKRPFERLRGVAARRWPAGAVTARVHRGSKTSTRPLSARYSRTSSRPRAPLRFLQVAVSTSTTRDRSNIPYHGGGRDDCHVGPRELPLEGPATAEGTQGQGSRTPSLDTPHRDCSRRRLCPNPDRFGHLLSRLPPSARSGVTWGEDDAANATCACKAHVARGSCGARFPRRNRTFTNPRGLLSLAVRDANGEASSPSSELPGDYPQRLFHHPRTVRGTLARIPMARPVLQGRTANRPVAERPQRPLTTSAFE